MSKKIQRKFIHYLPAQANKEKTETKGFNIQAAVTVLGGITGILVAVLWVSGRFYAAAYFNAMNIPPFQITYSIWEYAEASWLLLILYILSKIYQPVLLTVTIVLTVILLIWMLQRIFPKLKIERALQLINAQIQKFWQSIQYALILLLGAYLFYILLLTFIDIKAAGWNDGKNIVLEKSRAVEVFSKDFLPLGQGRVVPDTSPAVIQYDGLRLLTFNNEKYYLFRDVDPATCKPVQVFVINNSPNIQVVLGDVSPVDPPCPVTP
jgi:hypothetical protein